MHFIPQNIVFCISFAQSSCPINTAVNTKSTNPQDKEPVPECLLMYCLFLSLGKML